MNTPTRLAAALLLLCLPPWVAAEPVGRVIMTVGPVQAVDASERERAVSRHDPVYAGERLRTGTPRGRAQVRFVDDGLIKLSPGTEFAIDEYREPETDDDSGRAVMSLVEGALRKISGRIGSRDEDEYEMNTPTATVGIRGTDYSLEYCDEDCVGDNRELGLYGRVDDGSVIVENEFGTSEFEPGDHFFVPIDGTPGLLLTPPAGILDDIEDAETENGETEEQVEVAVTPTINDEPIDSEESPVFESGDAVADGLFEDDAAPTSALAFAAVEFGAEGNLLFSTFTRADDLVLRRDGDGRIIAVDANGSSVDATNASLFGSGEAQGAEGVFAGAFDGSSFLVNDSEVTDGLVMFAAADDSLTTPDQFAGLDGTLELGLSQDAPAVAFGEVNEEYQITALDVSLDLGSLEGTLDLLGLESGENLGITFLDEPLTLNEDGDFAGTRMEGQWETFFNGSSGMAEADLDGVLLGETADGGLVALSVERFEEGGDSIERIVGAAVLDADGYGEGRLPGEPLFEP